MEPFKINQFLKLKKASRKLSENTTKAHKNFNSKSFFN